MNIGSVGPGLLLAPQASRNDELLDVVVVTADERDKLGRHLCDEQTINQVQPPLAVYRGRKLEVKGNEVEFHLDDRPWPDPDEIVPQPPFVIEVTVHSKALQILTPAERNSMARSDNIA
jgi:diacylglycerol kinase family enzyme